MKKLSYETYKKALEAKCFDCCNYNPWLHSNLTNKEYNEAYAEIKHCSVSKCPIYMFKHLEKTSKS
jgi:hypothetical protein